MKESDEIIADKRKEHTILRDKFYDFTNANTLLLTEIGTLSEKQIHLQKEMNKGTIDNYYVSVKAQDEEFNRLANLFKE